MHISGATLDDILFQVLRRIEKKGAWIRPRKGRARELLGVSLALTNPRARFSRAESRAIIFSCLGEFLWYLAGSNQLKFIQYYIRRYHEFSDDGKTLFGAYGPRLFLPRQDNSVSRLIEDLKKKPDTRQAILQILRPEDLCAVTKDLPCTTTVQFFLRRDRLHAIVNMRSNDAFIGLPHDVFSFTMLQEFVASTIGCELGTYRHFVGSLHVYEKDMRAVERYLSEGLQRSTQPMPAMPKVRPQASANWLLRVERRIRSGNSRSIPENSIDEYWNDLARLLLIKAHYDANDQKSISALQKKMHSHAYNDFLRNRRMRIARAQQLSLSIDRT